MKVGGGWGGWIILRGVDSFSKMICHCIKQFQHLVGHDQMLKIKHIIVLLIYPLIHACDITCMHNSTFFLKAMHSFNIT